MAITVEMREQISQLYVALFGRAPDGEGLGFWTQLLDQGTSLTEIANMMYGTDPARDYFPLFLTNSEIITSFYVNVLGRSPDAEGLAFWTAKLNAAGATPGSVITEMIDVVANYTGTHPDGLTSQALFNNKVTVAQYYGENNGNIDDADVVLATVTAAAASVTAAIAAIDAGTVGQDGEIFGLTTGQDTVLGSAANDEVNGVFGGLASDTLTAGDNVDLGAGTLDTLKLVAQGVTASPAVVVKNTEFVTIQDTLGSTFNALLVENNPTISFANTLAGLTSTVTNGATGQTFGLAGKGNLTVDLATSSGTSDTVNVSLAGVGTSTSARSTVNVSDTNTVEKVTIATSGSNFVTLAAGSAAASVVVTGSGTNDFDMSAASATGALLSLDASASTGANTFRLGTSLGAGDSIKGGTSTDTVTTNFTLATLNTPTMTGVETLSADFDAAAILDLGSATGLTTVTLTGSTADQKVQNAASTVATLNVQSMADNDNDVSFSYKGGAGGPLTVNLSGAAFNLDDITLSGATAVTLNATGGFAHVIGNNTVINTDLTAFNVNIAASSKVDSGWAYVDGGVGARNVTVGANGEWSGGFSAQDDIGDITTTVATGAYAFQYIGLSGGGTIGNVTGTITGSDAALGYSIHNDHGDIGDVSLSITGDNNSGYLYMMASGGSIGNITITADGEENHIYAGFSAGDWEGTGSGDAPQGNIGDISVTMTGDDSTFSGGFDVSGGDIGNVTLDFTGDNFSASVGIRAVYERRDMDDDGNYDDYAFGGNIGNVSYSIAGTDASGGLYMASSGGSIGNISLTADDGASLHFWVSANAHPSGLVDAGNIGNVTIFVGDDANVSGYITASGGDIGNVSVTLQGENASGGLNINASMMSGGPDGDSDDYWKGGNVGDVSLTIDGDDSNYTMDVLASGGDIGNVTVSIDGDAASGYLYLHAEQVGSGGDGGDIGTVTADLGDDTSLWLGLDADGAVGAITLTGGEGVSAGIGISGGDPQVGDNTGSVSSISVNFGADSSIDINATNYSGSVGPISITMGANADVELDFSTLTGSVGAVTLAGGDSTSLAEIDIPTGVGVFGGVVATSWAGDLSIDLTGVTTGTTVMVGTGGSDVIGTEGADNVFFNSGVDEFIFDTTPTTVDQIFQFTGGAGKDVLNVVNAANFTAYTTNTADVLASGDFTKLTDIAGGDDITTAAGLLAALNGGEYALIDATAAASTYTFVTASSASSTTYYVFNAVETADASFDSVTLIGIVNGNAYSNLVAGNIA